MAIWAEKQNNLLRLWAYGSRVKGNYKIESDFDIAFEILPLLTAQEKIAFQSQVLPLWLEQLQQLSPWQIHLEPWAEYGTNVASFVAEANILIYERHLTNHSSVNKTTSLS